MTTFDTPYTFRCGATLRNRLMMSPMTTQQSFYNGTVTHDEIAYYTARSAGMGAVITGAANVQPLGKGWPGELSIDSDVMLPELKQLAAGIQSKGAKAIIQIFHAGRMTHRATLSGEQPVSASAVKAERADAEVPRAMSIDEIHETIAAFGEATRRAIQAGFDGVELHGANTYLIQQFFSPHSNRRTDEYGGSREKRYCFIHELLDTVFKTVQTYAKRPFIVGYRFSPEEYETPGIRFADTLWLLDQLRQTPLDYVHISLGAYAQKSQDPNFQEQSMAAYAKDALKEALPLVAVGGVRTREDVQNVLQQADLVAVGRQLLYDPAWALKLEHGADSDMVSGSFAKAIDCVHLNRPLYEFASQMLPKK